MNYFKVKSVLQSSGAACKINIIKYHGEKEGNYGKQHEYDILCDGQEMKWMATEYQRDRIKEVGKVNFMIQRWDRGGKTGFNFLDEGDVQVQPQNVSSQPAAPVDDVQERIIRGMCFNNACTILSGEGEDDRSPDAVKVVTLLLYTEMHDWLAGKEEVVPQSGMAHVEAERVPDPEEPPPVEDYKDDLPF